MAKLNPKNERIKRDYGRYQSNALGKSAATVDAILKSLSRNHFQHKSLAITI